MDLKLELNQQQYEAVSFGGKHLLVLAGAGTGKTKTIISRAQYLIEHGVDAKRILILSFTRKSANEIVSRIKSTLNNVQGLNNLSGHTFHSWCMNLIKSYPNIFPFKDYTVMDEDDSLSSIKLIVGKKFVDQDNNIIKPSSILDVYSYAKNTFCRLSDAIKVKIFKGEDNELFNNYISKNKGIFEDVIKKYINYKSEHKYIDYDDILSIVSSTLKNNLSTQKYISSKYDHILIDEMQDTNPLQYELLSSFYDNCSLFCVGDDAQSIYAFRGADFKTIHNFVNIIPNSEVKKLELNYRSTQEILDLSNWLLRQSNLKYDKHLSAYRGHGEKPTFVYVNNEWDEAIHIIENIKKSNSEHELKYKENLVLSRSIFKLRTIEGMCLKEKIPYTIFGGSSLMKSAHIRDVVSSLRIINNYKDELAWIRYLTLWPKIGEITATKIINHIILSDSLSDCINKLIDMNLMEDITYTLISIYDMQYSPSKAISSSLERMEEYLSYRYKNEWTWRKKDFEILKKVAAFSNNISEFISEYVLDPKLEVTIKKEMDGDDRITLSTIHSAKGLEADSCYIINVSPSTYPSPMSIERGYESIEEERRCLYVALTRAKNKLFIYVPIESTSDQTENNEEYFFNNLLDHLVNKNFDLVKSIHNRLANDQSISYTINFSEFNFD